MPAFSRKQQQVVGVFCLLYGVSLGAAAYFDAPAPLESSQLSQPAPPELGFYLDPPVDLNTGSTAELQLLPGIGAVRAQQIVAYRERFGLFTSLETLRKIKGIGPQTIRRLRLYLPESP